MNKGVNIKHKTKGNRDLDKVEMRKQHNKHISVQSNLFTRRSSESNSQNSLGNKFRSITLKQTRRIDFKATSWWLRLAHGAHGAFIRAVGITGAGGRLHYWIPAIKLSRVELNVRILKTAVLQSVLIMRLRESVWFYLCVTRSRKHRNHTRRTGSHLTDRRFFHPTLLHRLLQRVSGGFHLHAVRADGFHIVLIFTCHWGKHLRRNYLLINQ